MHTQHLIDPKDLSITEIAHNPPDLQLRIELPAKYVKRFQKKLKRSGQQLTSQEALKLLISIMLSHAIELKGLSPIFGPSPIVGAQEPSLKKDSPIVLEITLDDWEELGEIDYSKIVIQKPVQEITEEMIDLEMLTQQWMAGERDQTQSPIGSDVECNCSLTTLDSDTGFTLSPPTKALIAVEHENVRVHGCSIPCGKVFNAKSVGDVISLTATLPNNWPQVQLRSKKVILEFTLDSISKVTPATVEEVLEQYGTPSEFILRNQIQSSMEQRFTDGIAICMQEQLLDAIADEIDLQIPPRVIKSAVHVAKQGIERQLNAKSSDIQANKKILESLTPQCEKKALLSTKRKAITALLVRSNSVTPMEEELLTFIAGEAAVAGKRPDEYRQELIDSGQLNEVGRRLIISKVVKSLLDQCEIKPISNEEWNVAIAKEAS